MQIREITIQEGLGWELTKGIGRAARDQFIQKATGLSDPYATTEMPGTQKKPGPVDTATAPAAKPKPNYAQTGQANYKPAAVTFNLPGTPKVNPAAAPVPYTLDGRKLDPNNVNDAEQIANMQAQGVTSSTTAQLKQQVKQQ